MTHEKVTAQQAINATDDDVLQVADNSVNRFTELKQCTACKKVRPLKAFKRKLTRAQSQARGYVGAIRLEIESKLCKDCQPKPRKLEQLTSREIMTKAGSGDLNLLEAQKFVRERKENRNEKARRAVTMRWEKVYRAQWQELIHAISAELVPVHHQLKYAKKNLAMDKILFFSGYKSVLVSLRESLRIKAHVASEKAEGLDWRSFVPKRDYDWLVKLWNDIPVEHRTRLRHPAVLRKTDAPDEVWLDLRQPTHTRITEEVDRARTLPARDTPPSPMTEQQIQDSTDALMRELGIE